MEPKIEQQPKTVEQMIGEMRDSIEFVESRLGFIGDKFPYKDGKEAIFALKNVRDVIFSNEAKPYFDQWYDYATIFNNELTALKFAAEAAEREYQSGNVHENEELSKAKKILESLEYRTNNIITMAAA